MSDASDNAVGAVLQQFINDQWCPVAFFSKKLKPAETKYSTFDRELLAVYLAIKRFRHFVEGHQFSITTDHKPLTFALFTKSSKLTPRQIRHLDYIAQFTTDIRYTKGSNNPVADYHPIANGIIERFHRQLKSSLKSYSNPTNWTDILPHSTWNPYNTKR